MLRVEGLWKQGVSSLYQAGAMTPQVHEELLRRAFESQIIGNIAYLAHCSVAHICLKQVGSIRSVIMSCS